MFRVALTLPGAFEPTASRPPAPTAAGAAESLLEHLDAYAPDAGLSAAAETLRDALAAGAAPSVPFTNAARRLLLQLEARLDAAADDALQTAAEDLRSVLLAAGAPA